MMQSRRIDPLLRRAQEHEDEVARDLAERQRNLDTHVSRLEELRRYAEEYAGSQMAATSPAQLTQPPRLPRPPGQRGGTADAHGRPEPRRGRGRRRARLLLASREKQVLEQLAASYRAQERQVVERRDQRDMDDLGARRARQAQVQAGESGDNA